MIKFFRKIRHRLFKESRLLSYTFYAIGEIVLVVIGILIALQLNNAKEYKKERKLELKILKSIESDLSTDITMLTDMIRFEEELIQRNLSLMEILRDDESQYNQSMDTLFGSINRYGVFYPQRIGYESLKSIGLEVLRSDSLKAAIVHCYDVDYGVVKETLELKKLLYLDTNPIFLSELETVGNDKGRWTVVNKRPNDFEKLKANKVFYNHLSHIYAERLNFLEFTHKTLESAKNLHQKLKKEIIRMTDD
jgi:hypothetical protein